MFGAFWLIMIAYRLTQLLHSLHEVEGWDNSLGTNLPFTIRRILALGLNWLPTLLCVMFALNVEVKTTSGRIVALLGAIVLGAIGGAAIDHWVVNPLVWGRREELQPMFMLGQWLGALPIAGIGAALLYMARRDSDAMAKLHQEELDRVSLDRQMVEARLQVLQSQIEPHFLFNTLANVRRLYEIDPPQGKSMLQHLRGYLVAALPEMRASQSTLGRELALATAYLSVQKIRMGARLAFDIDVAEGLKATSFPSMMLVTLVENAIKHGLAPLPEGGSIRIVAREHGGHLQLQVQDDGAGFQSTSGEGVGVANTRTRLATLYGNRAKLLLEQNTTRGVTATLEFPLAVPAAAFVTT
jgi:hypothetical protein